MFHLGAMNWQVHLVIFLCAWMAWGFVSAQEPALTRHDFSGPGMFTTFRISCYTETKEQAEQATEACFKRIAVLNALFTDYDPTSELMRLCAPGVVYPVQVGPEMHDLLKRSCELSGKTDGAFDITCGHLSQLWRRAKRQQTYPPQDRLQLAVAKIGAGRIQILENSQIRLQPGTLLDVGGIAKGYAADECLRLLKQRGIPRAVVLAGGDTAIGEPPPDAEGWEIKLRTFTKAGEDDDLTVLHLARCGVSTSGDLYQFMELEGKRYSHIIDPRTGQALTQRVACSVIAPDCTTSDALATAMCVLGREKGTEVAKHLPGVQVRFATESP